MKLSDKTIQKLTPRKKQFKVSDGQSLFICVHPNGSKYWRYKYHWHGKEKCLAFGVYPEISLEEARELRQQARKLKREGTDPREYQRNKKIRAASNSENTFERLTQEWLDVRSCNWSAGYLAAIIARLQNDILPEIGHRSLEAILPTDVLKIARTVERRNSLEVSRKALQICGQIFRYGIITGQALSNPADHLWPALKRRQSKVRPYFTPNQLSQFLADLERYPPKGHIVTALKLMLLTFVRTKELCDARYDEFDLRTKLWRIPAIRMKVNIPHLVPLTWQSHALIEPILEQPSPWGYLLPHLRVPRDPMSKDSMRQVLYDLGYRGQATIHGIRATASTILNESGQFSSDVIERQLAHQEPNKIRKAYDHSDHLAERMKMMQWWADYLCEAGLKILGVEAGVQFPKTKDISNLIKVSA